MHFRTSLPLLSFAASAVILLLLPGCKTLKEKASTISAEATAPPAGDPGVSALLGMSFTEAASIAPQHLDEPKLPKVAADSIEVLSKTADGKPTKVRAKGRVFLQLDQPGTSHALCNEALISDDEVILRGKPVLQRGTSTVEGLSDVTVFYLFGQQLKVIGRHRLTNLGNLASASPWQNDSGGTASLLPPLDSSDVPENVREEMRKAAEAEAQLQRSRMGVPAAFPEALDGSQHPAAGVPVEKVKKP